MDLQKIYLQLSKEYNLDRNVVEKACNSLFKFIKLKMKLRDTKSILMAYLFKFRMKSKWHTHYTNNPEVVATI